MRAGELDHRLTLRRRGTQVGNPGGVARGPFADLFNTRCKVRPAPAKEIAVAGQAASPIVITVQVYDCERNRGITAADRAVLNGKEYGISSVLPPDRVSKSIDLLLTDQKGS